MCYTKLPAFPRVLWFFSNSQVYNAYVLIRPPKGLTIFNFYYKIYKLPGGNRKPSAQRMCPKVYQQKTPKMKIGLRVPDFSIPLEKARKID